MFRRMLFGLLITTSLLALTACGPKGPTKIAVNMTEYKYDPLTWTVPAGGQVDITLTNAGKLQHEWVIIKKGEQVTMPFDADDEDKVFWEIEAGPGETVTGTFTAPSDPGTYTIVCGTPGHLEQGMAATLTVQ